MNRLGQMTVSEEGLVLSQHVPDRWLLLRRERSLAATLGCSGRTTAPPKKRRPQARGEHGFTSATKHDNARTHKAIVVCRHDDRHTLALGLGQDARGEVAAEPVTMNDIGPEVGQDGREGGCGAPVPEHVANGSDAGATAGL